MSDEVPLVDEDNTYTYEVTLNTVISCGANPDATDKQALRQAILENLVAWLEAAGDDATREMFLSFDLIDKRLD